MSKFPYLLIGALLFIGLSACSTSPTAFEHDGTEHYNFSNDDVSLSVTPISEDFLIEKFGKKGNVFIQFPALLFSKENIVYQLNIDSAGKEINIDLKNVIIKIGDVTGRSKYRNQLLNDWSTYLKDTTDLDRAETLSTRYMYTNQVKVPPGESYSGLVVFLRKFPDEPHESISIGYTVDKGELQEVTIPLH